MIDIAQMDTDDYESTLRLLGEICGIVATEYLSAEVRLAAIDHALILAIGGPPEQARDFVRDVTLQWMADGTDEVS